MSRPVPFTYPYPRPSVTCDVVVFTMRGDDLAVLLIRRKDAPFKGHWALPGGFVDENEALERAALRELEEETGLGGVKLEQLGAYGDPGRDPRGHTITVAWLTYLAAEPKITAGDDAAEAEWQPLRALALAPSKGKTRKLLLAFDHAKIIGDAYRRLCQYLDDPTRDRAFEVFPSRFTIPELLHVYEVILGRKLVARAFKKRLFDLKLVAPQTGKASPRTELYRWNRP